MNPLTSLRDLALARLRRQPLAQRLHARLRRRRYERSVSAFAASADGRADLFPRSLVYEATMRCNLRCEFCYVGELLNIEGEWRQELSIETIDESFPRRAGLEVSLTGGEIFVRKDLCGVLEAFRRKGYVCRYLTTNGTLIDDRVAERLADLAAAGFLRHLSVSIDGPSDLHDRARGITGTFERAAAGLRKLQDAAAAKKAWLRCSVNTTVSPESLAALDGMVDVTQRLGVDAIGVNHLMYATPGEVTETVRLLGHDDPRLIATFVTDDPRVSPAEVRTKIEALSSKCRANGVRFDCRPRVAPEVIDAYYTPGAALSGRCLYPFLHARVGYSGKMYFCPFIRVEVGDLTQSSLEEIWNNERYVELRRRLIAERLFPVCRRCCKAELAPGRQCSGGNVQTRASLASR